MSDTEVPTAQPVQVIERLQLPATTFAPKIQAPGKGPFVVSYGVLGGVAASIFFGSAPLPILIGVQIIVALICSGTAWERLCDRDKKVAAMNAKRSLAEPQAVIIVRAGDK